MKPRPSTLDSTAWIISIIFFLLFVYFKIMQATTYLSKHFILIVLNFMMHTIFYVYIWCAAISHVAFGVPNDTLTWRLGVADIVVHYTDENKIVLDKSKLVLLLMLTIVLLTTATITSCCLIWLCHSTWKISQFCCMNILPRITTIIILIKQRCCSPCKNFFNVRT